MPLLQTRSHEHPNANLENGAPMQKPDSFGFLRLFVVCCAGMLGAQSFAAGTPAFTITATNVAMPTNGDAGTSQFTLTSVNGYSGRLVVNSQYSGGDMNAKPPNAGAHTAPFYTLNANSTATGTLTFYPYGKVVPIARLHGLTGLPNPAPALGLAVAGWFALRRRTKTARRFALVVLAVLSIAGVSACGSNGLSGVYPFTVTATDTVTGATANTQIMVTVP